MPGDVDYLEFLAPRIEEPPNSVKTPNPEKAPLYFGDRGSYVMFSANPRLALFASRWSILVCCSSVLWGAIAPLNFRDAATSGPLRRYVSRLGLIPASLVVGVFLAWPWLLVIGFGDWLHP